MIIEFNNLALVIELLLICILNVFEDGVYVYVKSAPFDTAVYNPMNDPLKVAGPI